MTPARDPRVLGTDRNRYLAWGHGGAVIVGDEPRQDEQASAG
jgi:hypothetical protein